MLAGSPLGERGLRRGFLVPFPGEAGGDPGSRPFRRQIRLDREVYWRNRRARD